MPFTEHIDKTVTTLSILFAKKFFYLHKKKSFGTVAPRPYCSTLEGVYTHAQKIFDHRCCRCHSVSNIPPPPPLYADDTGIAVDRAGGVAVDQIDKTGIFQWIEGDVNYADKNLNLGITAFSALSENKNTITYFQGSYNRQKATNRLNLGVGYRKLVGAAAIIGVNGFIDNKDGTQTAFTFNPSGVYQRYSLGLELKTAAFDVSANMYRPMSKGIIKDYKVLKGWDITTKGKIPLAPALSLGVHMYNFDGVNDAVVKGNKLIAEYKPNRTITLRGEYDKPNGDAAKTNIFMGFKWDFATAVQTPSQATKSAAVWHKRYDKVERQYDVKIAKASTIPTLAISGNDRLSAREWGNAVTANAYDSILPSSVTINGQTINVSYTFAVKSSTVGGVTSTADIDTATGAIDSGKITDSGDIVLTATRAEVAGKLASATKDITIPITKKTLTLVRATDLKSHDDSDTPTGSGTAASPWQMVKTKRYKIGEFVTIPSVLNGSTTVTLHWTEDHAWTSVDMQISKPGNTGLVDSSHGIKRTGFTLPTPLTRYIVDNPGGPSATVEFRFTFTNPDTDKYDLSTSTVSAYLKSATG